MKIRADFVTNSSSSSYCTIKITTDEGQFGIDDVTQWGFGSFWFHDPTSRLADIKSASELLDIIRYCLDATPGELGPYNEKELTKKLAAIEDVSSVRRIDVSLHEEIADRGDWDYGYQPRDVRYSYDFATGAKNVWADVNWRSYKGAGDSLKPDFRCLDGEKLPFDFYQYVKGYHVIDCHSGAKEIVIPERILEDGREMVVQGIGPRCFKDKRSMQSLVLPATVTFIAPDAFDGIKRTLKSIRIAGRSADDTTFVRDGSKLMLTVSPEKELTIPNDVTELGESAFGGCLSLRTIELHDGMKKPTMKALQSCSSLTYVVLTDGSKINVSKKDAMRCFTISRGVIRYDYEKCEKYGIKQPGRKVTAEEAGKPKPTSRKSTRKSPPSPWTVAAIGKLWKCRKAGGKTQLMEFKADDCVAIVPKNVGSSLVSEAYANCGSMTLGHVVVPETVTWLGQQLNGGQCKVVVHALPGSPAEKWAKEHAIYVPLEYDSTIDGGYIAAAEERKAELEALISEGNLAEQARRYRKVWFAKMWWHVIGERDGKALIIADYPIRDADLTKVRADKRMHAILEMPYDDSEKATKAENEQSHAVAWENCSLRAWLNGEFLERAGKGELSFIADSNVPCSSEGWAKDPRFAGCVHEEYYPGVLKCIETISDCHDTIDKVFCLSVDELLELDQGLVSWYTWTRTGGLKGVLYDSNEPSAFRYSERDYYQGVTLDKSFSLFSVRWRAPVVPAAWIVLDK